MNALQLCIALKNARLFGIDDDSIHFRYETKKIDFFFGRCDHKGFECDLTVHNGKEWVKDYLSPLFAKVTESYLNSIEGFYVAEDETEDFDDSDPNFNLGLYCEIY